MNTKALYLVICLIAPAIFASSCFAVVFVDQNAPGPAHDGTTWDTAFAAIQEGIEAATPGGEVWVADGIYVENVVMGEGVAIYGGFLGAEPGGYEDSLDQRDFVNNVTTIDGNQSGSCVVMAVAARVDGFTVTNGSGTLVDDYRYGGGFYCYEVGESSAIANCTITANSASGEWGAGGGIYCRRSSPSVTDNTITCNTARDGAGMGCGPDAAPVVARNVITTNEANEGFGGGVDLTGSSATIADCVIAGNSARFGGGIACSNWSTATVVGNIISGNWAGAGGGINCNNASPVIAGNTISANSARKGGGFYSCCSSSPTLAGNVITDNSAENGGGIGCSNSAAVVTCNTISDNRADVKAGGVRCENSSLTMINNAITNNWAGVEGGGLHCRDCRLSLVNNTIAGNSATSGRSLACDSPFHEGPSHIQMANCILWNGGDEIRNDDGSTITITYSDVCGGWPGDGNIDADPMFVDPHAGDFHLTPDSPCVEMGYIGAPGLPETDWDGEERIVGENVDIGADEYLTHYTEAPIPQPECDGPLFGEPQAGFPGWVWFSIPITPAYSADPNDVLGFECGGWLWRYDKYIKAPEAYQPPFAEWELAVGDSYLLYLQGEVPNPSYEGLSPFTPFTFEHKLGRQGWTWIGMPGLSELEGEDFMSSVRVKYLSDETGYYRTSREDYEAIPDNWITWGWPYWNTWRQGPETFTPYAPFGHNTCYPWVGYRVWIKVGTATDDDDPDQVTLIWRKAD